MPVKEFVAGQLTHHPGSTIAISASLPTMSWPLFGRRNRAATLAASTLAIRGVGTPSVSKLRSVIWTPEMPPQTSKKFWLVFMSAGAGE